MTIEDGRSAKRLPVTMRAVFQDLLLVTYAVAPEELAALLPAKVHPCVREGKGFVSIVVANIRGMRPAALPEAAGSNYYQIVYRAVVRLRDAAGVERPGVFFLRSDGNDPVMNFFGNRLTEFRFHYFRRSAIGLFARGDQLLVSVESHDRSGDLVLNLTDLGPAEEHRPSDGFTDIADEKETLVQLFHAYAHDPERRIVYDLEIERGEWQMHRLRYDDGFSAFFSESPFGSVNGEPNLLPLYSRMRVRMEANGRSARTRTVVKRSRVPLRDHARLGRDDWAAESGEAQNYRDAEYDQGAGPDKAPGFVQTLPPRHPQHDHHTNPHRSPAKAQSRVTLRARRQ